MSAVVLFLLACMIIAAIVLGGRLVVWLLGVLLSIGMVALAVCAIIAFLGVIGHVLHIC